MKFAFLTWTSMIGSPGFSRTRLAWQSAATPAGIHRLKPGLPDGISEIVEAFTLSPVPCSLSPVTRHLLTPAPLPQYPQTLLLPLPLPPRRDRAQPAVAQCNVRW